MMGPYKRGPKSSPPLPRASTKVPSICQDALTRHHLCQSLGLGLPSLQTQEKAAARSCPPMAFCCSSLSRGRQEASSSGQKDAA